MSILSLLLLLNFYVLQSSCTYFSTKTPYDFLGNFQVEPLFPESHEVMYLRYLGRHGERFHSLNDIKSIQSFLANLSLISGNPKSFIDLSKIQFDPSRDKALCPRGIKQLYHIGRRYRERLGSVFQTTVRAENFRFESTCRSRAVHSMIAFIQGMFNLSENTVAIPDIKIYPCDNDHILRFFDFCKSYSSMQKCLKLHKKEKDRFLNKEIMKNIVETVSSQLGLNQTIDSSHIESLYLLCVYDFVINGQSSPDGPCRFFDEESFIAFDYLLDMKSFYKRGNAFALNTKIGCKLFQNIYDSVMIAFDSCPRNCPINASCQAEFKADFGFAHAETLIPILVI